MLILIRIHQAICTSKKLLRSARLGHGVLTGQQTNVQIKLLCIFGGNQLSNKLMVLDYVLSRPLFLSHEGSDNHLFLAFTVSSIFTYWEPWPSETRRDERDSQGNSQLLIQPRNRHTTPWVHLFKQKIQPPLSQNGQSWKYVKMAWQLVTASWFNTLTAWE